MPVLRPDAVGSDRAGSTGAEILMANDAVNAQRVVANCRLRAAGVGRQNGVLISIIIIALVRAGATAEAWVSLAAPSKASPTRLPTHYPRPSSSREVDRRERLSFIARVRSVRPSSVALVPGPGPVSLARSLERSGHDGRGAARRRCGAMVAALRAPRREGLGEAYEERHDHGTRSPWCEPCGGRQHVLAAVASVRRP